MALRHTKRFLQIYRTFSRYRCYFFLKNSSYYRFIVFFGYFLAPKPVKSSYLMSDSQKLAQVFQELGPAFIKLGQALSVRPDLIGDRVAQDLSMLQDRLPPFPTAIAKQIVERELGKKISEVFRTFGEPAAAASISQVHFATDLASNEVAVKILRPNIEERFFKDINLLFWLSGIINRKFPRFIRLKLRHMVNMVASISKIEMDLLYEAAAADELAKNFKDDTELKVPKIYWQLTSSRVLVAEKFTGIRIDDIRKLQDAGHNVDDLLRKCADIFLKQALRDGFFHADMHPGNMLVNDKGQICVFDFGIMGRIDRKNRIFLAEMLNGFLNRDYKKVADIHFDAGFIPADQSRELFAQACRAVGEPIFDLPQNQISIAKLLQRLLKITEQFKMEAQPQLLLLQKTMMMAEGIGRKLNPNINFWALSRDLVQEWGEENLGPKAKLQEGFSQLIQSVKSINESSKQLEKIVTSKGFVTYSSSLEKRNGNIEESNFWKGFITAILLTILILLGIIKFHV